MPDSLHSLQPGSAHTGRQRRRLGRRHELMLALLPTLTILSVFALVDAFSRQRLLFASLASSAFLIYLDPEHGTNRVRTVVVAQTLAAVSGCLFYSWLGGGYLSGGLSMTLAIVGMVLLDAVHPPAVSTALSFAFRTGKVSNLALFMLALAMVAVLVILQRLTLVLTLRGRADGTHAP
ncbi:HPP family protein [Acidiferrobacter sp. SPIII_3]|uniref:HPP family protein n=1 Tax=Acidiferrobacter sp. SPIII_3 TaxID=1281578 RepID=UPI000D72CE95|nr:HPP family protein [Acidiferrobacter sp. SPIII_3]AWP23389.1 HPP family protein [Acidiferrobacter sp. SPIII_3]